MSGLSTASKGPIGMTKFLIKAVPFELQMWLILLSNIIENATYTITSLSITNLEIENSEYHVDSWFSTFLNFENYFLVKKFEVFETILIKSFYWTGIVCSVFHKKKFLDW